MGSRYCVRYLQCKRHELCRRSPWNQLNVAPNTGLIILACTFIGLALISGLFTFIMRQTIIVASRRIEYDLKNDIYAQYQRLDQAFYKKNNTGDLMSRATEDVSRVRMYLGPALMYGINLFFLITFVLLSMVQIDPVLTAWVLIPLPFLSLSIYYVNDKINRGSEAIQRQLSFLTTSAQEFFSGIRVIKSYAQKRWPLINMPRIAKSISSDLFISQKN